MNDHIRNLVFFSTQRRGFCVLCAASKSSVVVVNIYY